MFEFNVFFQECDLTKVRNPEKWVAGLGLPLVSKTKPKRTSWMFNFGGFTDSSKPHKQPKGYFFLSLVATSLLSRKCLRQRDFFFFKILKSGKILRNHRAVLHKTNKMLQVNKAYSVSSPRLFILVIKLLLLFFRKLSKGSLISTPTPRYMSIFSLTSPPETGSTIPCSLAPRPWPPQPEIRQNNKYNFLSQA